MRSKWMLCLLLCCTMGASGQEEEDSLSLHTDTTFTVVEPAYEDSDEPSFDSLPAGAAPMLQSRAVPDSVIQRLKSEDAYWYADEALKQKERRSKEPWFLKPWFRKLLWYLLIALFISILVWFLASSNIRLFRRPLPVLDGEDAAADTDIFAVDFEAQIRAAESAGNLRLALRMRYLQLLRWLSEKERIDYAPGKTNAAYVSQLYGTTAYRNFSLLTRSFEYSWYGQFPVEAPIYERLLPIFEQVKKELS